MPDRLNWVIATVEGVACIELKGSVDEDADFGALAREIGPAKRIRFDLGQIVRINSCGVREWVNFVRALPAGSSLEFEKCSPVVVSQMNMISNFAGTARVLSMQAPYVCDPCGFEQNVLLDVHDGKVPKLDAVTCPKCGSAMVFDDVEDGYFAFLALR